MISDEQLGGILIFPIASLGVLANWTVVILIRKIPSLKNSFGSLTASQSIADAIHCTIFAFIVSPMLIFNLQFLKNNSTLIGFVLLVAAEVSMYSHFCMSLNRFCSIVAPIKYTTIFSQMNTKILILLSWIITVVPSFYFYVYNDCRFYYKDGTSMFGFLNTPICKTISYYSGYVKYNVFIILIVIIDIITVSMVRRYKAQFSKSSISSSQPSVKKHNAEISFLKQACFQAFFFALELFGAFRVMPYVNEPFLRFSLCVLAWIAYHTSDGIITIVFNNDFSKIIFNRIKIKDVSSFVTRSGMVSNSLSQIRQNANISDNSRVSSLVKSGNAHFIIV